MWNAKSLTLAWSSASGFVSWPQLQQTTRREPGVPWDVLGGTSQYIDTDGEPSQNIDPCQMADPSNTLIHGQMAYMSKDTRSSFVSAYIRKHPRILIICVGTANFCRSLYGSLWWFIILLLSLDYCYIVHRKLVIKCICHHFVLIFEFWNVDNWCSWFSCSVKDVFTPENVSETGLESIRYSKPYFTLVPHISHWLGTPKGGLLALRLLLGTLSICGVPKTIFRS